MHARVTALQMDPERIDQAVADLEEQDIPEFEKADGFKGFTVLVDRSAGKVVGTSYWSSKETMDASEELGQGARERAAQTGGASGEPQVDRFEVAIDTFVK